MSSKSEIAAAHAKGLSTYETQVVNHGKWRTMGSFVYQADAEHDLKQLRVSYRFKDVRMVTIHPVMVTCAFCKIRVCEEHAPNLGWVPFFHLVKDGGTIAEMSQPVCPDCDSLHLTTGADGEPELHVK